MGEVTLLEQMRAFTERVVIECYSMKPWELALCPRQGSSTAVQIDYQHQWRIECTTRTDRLLRSGTS